MSWLPKSKIDRAKRNDDLKRAKELGVLLHPESLWERFLFDLNSPTAVKENLYSVQPNHKEFSSSLSFMIFFGMLFVSPAGGFVGAILTASWILSPLLAFVGIGTIFCLCYQSSGEKSFRSFNAYGSMLLNCRHNLVDQYEIENRYERYMYAQDLDTKFYLAELIKPIIKDLRQTEVSLRKCTELLNTWQEVSETKDAVPEEIIAIQTTIKELNKKKNNLMCVFDTYIPLKETPAQKDAKNIDEEKSAKKQKQYEVLLKAHQIMQDENIQNIHNSDELDNSLFLHEINKELDQKLQTVSEGYSKII